MKRALRRSNTIRLRFLHSFSFCEKLQTSYFFCLVVLVCFPFNLFSGISSLPYHSYADSILTQPPKVGIGLELFDKILIEKKKAIYNKVVNINNDETWVRDVDQYMQKEWINNILPLPQEIMIRQEIELIPKDIGFLFSEAPEDIEKNVSSQLLEFFQKYTGIEPKGTKFKIIAGVIDQDNKVCGFRMNDVERLRQLPNKEQAYIIRPVGENKLVLTALNSKGLYYGMQTLQQLLSWKINQKSVVIPLVTVTDWPDMNERGFWNIGYLTPEIIPWLASMKLNFTSFQTEIILNKDQLAQCPVLPMDLIQSASDHAFTLLPHAPHFDYWWKYGRDELYPELVGKGDGARNPVYHWGGDFAKCRVPCMATPLLKQLLTEWIESAASQGLLDFSLWLSEHTAQCECAECLKNGPKQMFKETQASIAAIMAARKKYPGIKGRIFFTMSYGDAIKDSYESLAILPNDIRAERVYGRNEAFDKFAAEGNLLVDYNGPPMGPGYFTLRYIADVFRDKLSEYYDVGYSGLFSRGRSHGSEVSNQWERDFSNYQYSAMAEWAWNNDGRDLKQFAEAWATLNKVNLPSQFAKWTEVTRPVVSLACDWEYKPTSNWLKVTETPDKKQLTPVWTTTLPGHKTIDPLLLLCEQAIPIAEKIADSSVLLETQYLHSYLMVMDQINDLCLHSTEKSISASQKTANIQEDIKNIKTSIKNLKHLRFAITTSPEFSMGSPEQIIIRHEAWAGELEKLIAQ